MFTSKATIYNTEIMFPLLTVDPGEHTGFALWIDAMRQTPIETGVFSLEKKLDKDIHYFQDWVEQLCLGFRKKLKRLKPKTVVIEGCEVFGTSAKSVMTVKRSKHTNIPPLFLLAYLIGAYMNESTKINANVIIKNFRDWGGNLSPVAVVAQVNHLTGTMYKSQHIYDAVGLGLNIMGRMK